MKRAIGLLLSIICICTANAAVVLETFNAIPANCIVTLQWVTSSETNNASFKIIRWHQLEALRDTMLVEATNSATGSTYERLDNSVSNGYDYEYSLYATDIDGTEELLAVSDVELYCLPVELVSWDASPGDGYVELHWVTAFEEDVDYFGIERNGEVLAHIAATNNVNGGTYVFSDNDVINTYTYCYELYAILFSGEHMGLAHFSVIPREEWPGDLTYFTAQLYDHTVHLYWETSYESNELNRFEVDRDGELVFSVPVDPCHWYEWPDSNLVNDVEYTYLLSAVDNAERRYGLSTLVLAPHGPEAIEAPPEIMPHSIELLGNYPNPFNSTTTIRYRVPNAAKLTLSIYNVEGREVAKLVDGPVSAGEHSLQWHAVEQASGIYFVTLKSGTNLQTHKMVLLK